jgi:hypothetical protein
MIEPDKVLAYNELTFKIVLESCSVEFGYVLKGE